MDQTMANPIGGYTDPYASPNFQAWLRQQLLEQAISAQARNAVASSPVLQSTPGAVPLANAQGSDAGMLPPPAQAAVVPPQPQATDTGMLYPPNQPAVAAAQPQTTMPPPPAANGGALAIEQPARGTTVPGAGQPAANGFQMAGMPDDVKQMFVGPPKTPEEIQARHSAWSDFIDNLRADPMLPQMLLKFGTSMMQPIAPGQTPVGHFGQALQGSVDYLAAQKMQAAELAKTQAETAKTQAQTATETQRPAQVQAETGSLQAGTARTQAETATINSQREGLAQKLQAEITRMQKEGNLNDQQAALLAEKTKTHPGEVASEIALREAHAFYFTHPEMHARANANALESARMQSVHALANAFVHGGDDELTALYKKDPNTAMNKAIVQAQAGQVGQFWKNAQEDQEAEYNYEVYSKMYDDAARSGDLPSGMTRERFIMNKLLSSNVTPSVATKIQSRIGKDLKKSKDSTAPNGRPSLDSFQK